MPKYNLEEYVAPFWKGNLMRYETVFFVGETDAARLLYAPKGKVKVYNYGLQTEYAEGADYVMDGDVIRRVKGGNLPYMAEEDYFLPSFERFEIRVNENAIPAGMSAPRFFRYGEAETFTKAQIAVVYEYDERENLPAPTGKKERFSRFLEKRQRGEDTAVLFYGDSITTGCNSSGLPQGGEVAPFAESFPEMVTKTLGKNVKLINTAVGGWSVQNGWDAVDERVKAHQADVFVLAFGMNNGWTSPEEFQEVTEKIVLAYREKNPDGEVVLVSTTLPNTDSNWVGNQPAFAKTLYELEEKYPFCAVADMTAFHRALLAKKRYRDMTGNNVNHPNDFLARAYAQVILQTILG